MAYEVDGEKEFLGFNFRVQTPLQMQDYRTSANCISNWVVMAPSGDGWGMPEELVKARARFSDWFKNWESNDFHDILKFRDWIAEDARETNSERCFQYYCYLRPG
jgi:hypothetical protein